MNEQMSDWMIMYLVIYKIYIELILNNLKWLKAWVFYILTCSLLELRECRFIYIVVDRGGVGVVPDKKQVAYIWMNWTLPKCQTETGHQNNVSVTR